MTEFNGSSESPESLGLPPIYQVGYVVHHLERAVATWEPFYGPFNTFETDMKVDYRGVPTRVHLRIGIGHSGPLEIEFIEVVSGDSPHRAWIEEHGESIMHVAFKVDDVDAELERLSDVGCETVWHHRMPETPSIVFAYAQSPEGHILELTQGF